MVIERPILLGIEHLQHGGGGVAPVVGREFVDFVEEHDRVYSPGLLHGRNNTTRHGADVGAAVTPDFRLITHTTETDADEATPHCRRDRASEAGLGDARGTNQAEELSCPGRCGASGEFAYREE